MTEHIIRSQFRPMIETQPVAAQPQRKTVSVRFDAENANAGFTAPVHGQHLYYDGYCLLQE
ncbi:hypothetical protein [Desulfobotulus sp.]|jgi:hypothetical protein|uniref:hypothetical protein n=1 Tax=Desulfobotulus sp. TaxID=1940337 RepID=UPI002A368E96|nr:hypothetical protein [Desulfobotulus sp.]MDY0164792.1 hypothetical protein [Desulfobotulus sp.]